MTTADPFYSDTPPSGPDPLLVKRNWAYRCFLGVAAALLIQMGCDALGRAGWLPDPVAAGMIVFLLLPLTGITWVAALAGMVLTLRVRRDLRLYILSLLTLGLAVYFVRMHSLHYNQPQLLVYPVAVGLFSLRWWLERPDA